MARSSPTSETARTSRSRGPSHHSDQLSAALAGRRDQPGSRPANAADAAAGGAAARLRRRSAGSLALARSLELIDQLEARLRALLAVGTLIARWWPAGLGLRATRDALRPLDHVIKAAREIGAASWTSGCAWPGATRLANWPLPSTVCSTDWPAMLEAQRRFVADAAHELRTPLTALGGMVEMLQTRGGPRRPGHGPADAEYDESRDRATGRLVADLLTLSRLDSDQPLALTGSRWRRC